MDKITITIEGVTNVLRSVFGIAAPDRGDKAGPGPESEVTIHADKITASAVVAELAPAPVLEATLAPEAAPAPEADLQTAPAVLLDANGVPWDPRINTSNKGRTAKGVFKRKPSLETPFYDSIVAELRAAQLVAGPEAAAAAFTIAPDTALTPSAAAAFVPPPAAEPESAGMVITTYAELNAAIGTAGKSMEAVNAAVLGIGLQSYALLGGRPDLIPAVAKALGL